MKYTDTGSDLEVDTDRTYHFDGLGSTKALTDQNKVVTDEYSYDDWGNVTSHTNPDPEHIPLTTDNPYQYVGELGYYTHYQEPTLGLLQVGVRYYDPQTGRFTQLDPIGDGVNWYEYAGGNPVNAVDPYDERTVVIYYNRREENGLWQQAGDSYYFDSHSKDVQMVPVLHRRDFVAAWNKLENDLDVDDVYLYLHGGAGQLFFRNETMSFDRGPERFSDLHDVRVHGKVYLLSCLGGAGPEGNNLAWMFAKKTNASVIACEEKVSFGSYNVSDGMGGPAIHLGYRARQAVEQGGTETDFHVGCRRAWEYVNPRTDSAWYRYFYESAGTNPITRRYLVKPRRTRVGNSIWLGKNG